MRISTYTLSNSNFYFHAAKLGLLYHLKWSWCGMPVISLVKGPISISVCLYLPAGKSFRQMNSGFDIRKLPPPPRRTLPFPCSERGHRPSPHPYPEYQRPAADTGTGHLPGEPPVMPQLRTPSPVIGRMLSRRLWLRSLGLCGSDHH